MNANRQTVEVVVPVFNEERALRPNIELLVDYLRREFPFRFGVVVADNASSDRTSESATALATAYEEVDLLRLDTPASSPTCSRAPRG